LAILYNGGTPKTDEEQAKAHFNITDEQWNSMRNGQMATVSQKKAGNQNSRLKKEYKRQLKNLRGMGFDSAN